LLFHAKQRTQIVFENRVLRKIFGPKRGEVAGDQRKVCNEELHNLYTSPNIIRMMKSKRIRWERHVVHMGVGEEETTQKMGG
jgi:hypothetical protein